MNKLVIAVLLALCLMGCHRKSFINHSLNIEKVADDCSQVQAYFRLTSNIAGERYEFEKCLPVGFKTEEALFSRQGDTIFVGFAKPGNGRPGAAFHVSLDIDSYPAYHFLTIDEDTYIIGASKN